MTIGHFCGQNLSKAWYTFTDNFHRQLAPAKAGKKFDATMIAGLSRSALSPMLALAHDIDTTPATCNRRCVCEVAWPPPPHHRAWKQGPYAGGDAGGKFLPEN